MTIVASRPGPVPSRPAGVPPPPPPKPKPPVRPAGPPPKASGVSRLPFVVLGLGTGLFLAAVLVLAVVGGR